MKNLLFASVMVMNSAVVALAGDVMPAVQQNELLKKYCVVCHTDAHRNGGLTLEHFDAAHPDAGVAAMIVSKLKGGAFGASGQPLPDKPTRAALEDALVSASEGAKQWVVDHARNTAGIVREVVSPGKPNPDLYRLTVACDPITHEGEIQLAWSPDVPPQGQVMSAGVDGRRPVTYTLEGKESMANGQAGTSGPGAVVLRIPFPKEKLTVSNVLAGQTVLFPFSDLPENDRAAISSCWTAR